jgi:hypothetical protein
MAGVATAAGACCTPVIAPAVVAVLGAGGAAWAAGLSPWAPWILLASAALIGLAHWRLRRASVPASARRGALTVIGIVWVATLVWLIALAIQVWTTAVGAMP